MKNCWASSLGDCDRLSNEHVVSQALFVGDTVEVSGFLWCKDETKTIGLARLTAKILCKRHNSMLSDVDAAGGLAFGTFREMRRLANVRERMRDKLCRVIHHRIDGKRLERWFLKTLINLVAGSDHLIGRGTANGTPPHYPVEVAFGEQVFAPRAGLFAAVYPGQKVDSRDVVHAAPLLRENRVEGGLFAFRGLRFLLFLDSAGPPERLSGIRLGDDDWSECQLIYHPAAIKEMQGKHLSQVVEIEW